MTFSTPYTLLGSAFTVIGRLKVAPVSAPITVTLVEVCVVIDLAITFTDLPVIVIERFLSDSLRKTGVVVPDLTKKSSSNVPSGNLLGGTDALTLPPPADVN